MERWTAMLDELGVSWAYQGPDRLVLSRSRTFVWGPDATSLLCTERAFVTRDELEAEPVEDTAEMSAFLLTLAWERI